MQEAIFAYIQQRPVKGICFIQWTLCCINSTVAQTVAEDKFMMKKLTDVLGIVLLGSVILVFAIIAIPIYLLWSPFGYYFDWLRKRRFEEYLLELGDKNFFCYNNRIDAKAFIEKELIPRLDQSVEILYLDGHEVKSSYFREYMSMALYSLKSYQRFPHLIKIRDGKMIDESVNNEFFNTMNQNKPLDKLLADVHSFFGIRINNINAA